MSSGLVLGAVGDIQHDTIKYKPMLGFASPRAITFHGSTGETEHLAVESIIKKALQVAHIQWLLRHLVQWEIR